MKPMAKPLRPILELDREREWRSVLIFAIVLALAAILAGCR
jgi:hypothetical protein